MGTQREKIMGSEGVFMGLIMGDEISEHPSACHKKVVRYYGPPIMPGTQILWVPYFFFQHSITFCSYLLWVQEDRRRARFVYPVEKIWMQQGLKL
jgi:hypothetical protein